ncbi:metallophosphoesterase [Pseudomonas fontis]|uniref:Metallophosphoesterase n=1 Tax=Pseudomonas fontis TaxID=2942633 RepID=A0ABT5NLD6_9PSED|nr:metallophosphoesterase [Pseudomonas fontis]MDD0976183.1 metallophosphoesterase [Pseudomonas fontis]MDD0989054.1 metallophosphoesterase [Pseudomonas fontis]
MNTMLQVAANTRGRDLAVGDVHGHFTRLQHTLDAVGFDPAVDRLFSVGDLVDRGPECEQVLAWLDQPWLVAVQGNHEGLAVAHVRGQWLDLGMYRTAGGGWFLDLPAEQQLRYVERFERIPLAVELETALGPVGLLHADCPFADWRRLREMLRAPTLEAKVQEVCQWSRRRVQHDDETHVAGLRALVVGHTPLAEVKVLGNVWHIDTGGWASGHFTLLDLGTLEVVAP